MYHIVLVWTLLCSLTVFIPAGSDYTSKEGRVTFYPGMSTSTPFYVDLRNDDMLEGLEGFKVQLEVENAWTSKVKALQPETDVTILDDDCKYYASVRTVHAYSDKCLSMYGRVHACMCVCLYVCSLYTQQSRQSIVFLLGW